MGTADLRLRAPARSHRFGRARKTFDRGRTHSVKPHRSRWRTRPQLHHAARVSRNADPQRHPRRHRPAHPDNSDSLDPDHHSTPNIRTHQLSPPDHTEVRRTTTPKPTKSLKPQGSHASQPGQLRPKPKSAARGPLASTVEKNETFSRGGALQHVGSDFGFSSGCPASPRRVFDRGRDRLAGRRR